MIYRLTLKGKKLYWPEDSSTYETIETEQHFDCGSVDQLVGLLQFMVATSDKELDIVIARRDDTDD